MIKVCINSCFSKNLAQNFFLTKNEVEINVEITDNAVCENENILNFLVFIINKIELHHWGNG